MAISNGSVMTKADLDALAEAQLAAIRADNARLPLGFHQAFQFANLVAATAATRRKAQFVVPFDCYLETLTLRGGSLTAASVTTATLSGTGGMFSLPISISLTSTGALDDAARLFLDNTKTKAGYQVAATSRAFRAFTQGSTVDLSVVTTSVALTSMVTAGLVLRQMSARA